MGSFINNGQLSVIDGKGIFGGNYLETLTDATAFPTNPLTFTSSTNHMAVATVTGMNLLASENTDLVCFAGAYSIRRP